MGWSYIAPVVKVGDMNVSVTSKAIAVTENLDINAWILKYQAEMEPRWSLQDITLIFGDGLLKKYVLGRLYISKSCVLRLDYYHVMQ